ELPDAVWCLIGHLQTNKVKRALELFDEIHSVDSLKLAAELNRRCQESGRELPVLLQINSSGEAQKYGLAPEETLQKAARLAELPALRLRGLMTMGPLTDDQSAIRKAFHTTRQLHDRMQRAGLYRPAPGRPPELSMGMSDDFALGIAEGSTMVRIGTAIFAPHQDV
ncbi:MAG TPA: YggS family pyridoxal phosphate-dependent enzyme, partial [candidate division Zixibacteria bacterium]|nr:YggS family pyridoxal phosphate-dependent enzyme [candidate division Zixibacteria bacterium]